MRKNKKIIFIVVGILLMIGGFGGATLKIPTTWHYFGVGVAFGVGFCVFIAGLFDKQG